MVAEKTAKNVRGLLFLPHPVDEKVAISDQYLAIARKLFKIDGYMLLCV